MTSNRTKSRQKNLKAPENWRNLKSAETAGVGENPATGGECADRRKTHAVQRDADAVQRGANVSQREANSGQRNARKPYQHTAYWYAKHAKKPRVNRSFALEYLEELREPYRRQGYAIYEGIPAGTGFNPLLFGIMVAVDIGIAIENSVRKILDPEERARMKRELMRDLRIARRPFYYARETERRRQLAAARRKVTRRTTLAPCPTPAQVLAAWHARKTSKENMILLGGLLHDLECYVDNSLRFDEGGDVIGRNGGIRGWIAENLPDLLCHYKTLMRYKAMAIRLRQATETRDPTPTAALLGEWDGDSHLSLSTPGGQTPVDCGACGDRALPLSCGSTARDVRRGCGVRGDRTLPFSGVSAKRDARRKRKADAAQGKAGATQPHGTRHEVVEAILTDPRSTFASILEHLAHRLDPEAVFTDAPAATRSK